MTICIVDTSVLCNVLDIPDKNQRRDDARATLRSYIKRSADLLLPLAAVYETGRHIAQLGDGRQRRGIAAQFVEQVRATIDGRAPWKPCPLPEVQDLASWLDRFPDAAMRKLSLADLSIIEIWRRQCDLHPTRRVLIWSYDRTDLGGYDRDP